MTFKSISWQENNRAEKWPQKNARNTKGRSFIFCVLCVLLRQFRVVVAQAALGKSVSIQGQP
jgi:hypothetical protein